jgi:hypothetical protein
LKLPFYVFRLSSLKCPESFTDSLGGAEQHTAVVLRLKFLAIVLKVKMPKNMLCRCPEFSQPAKRARRYAQANLLPAHLLVHRSPSLVVCQTGVASVASPEQMWAAVLLERIAAPTLSARLFLWRA